MALNARRRGEVPAQDGEVEIPPDHQAGDRAAHLHDPPGPGENRRQVEFGDDPKGLGLEGVLTAQQLAGVSVIEAGREKGVSHGGDGIPPQPVVQHALSGS